MDIQKLLSFFEIKPTENKQNIEIFDKNNLIPFSSKDLPVVDIPEFSQNITKTEQKNGIKFAPHWDTSDTLKVKGFQGYKIHFYISLHWVFLGCFWVGFYMK